MWNGKKWVQKGTVKTTTYTFNKLSKNKNYKFAVVPYNKVAGKITSADKVTSVSAKTKKK